MPAGPLAGMDAVFSANTGLPPGTTKRIFMGYLVLARKYRPQSFEEVVGQVHVTQTLANAIRHQRVAQIQRSKRLLCHLFQIPLIDLGGPHIGQGHELYAGRHTHPL